MPPLPHPPIDAWPIPTFNFHIQDLDHEGVDVFLNSVRPKEALRIAVLASFNWLYNPENVPRNVKEITLVLKPMPGVAHTFGSHSHKTIEFSLDYIKGQTHRAQDEIMGVLVHEVVHCYQYNALDSCPGGLIEGMADYVRLHAGLDPPHWKNTPGEKWDDGYDKTAYFLNWIETAYGDGIIRKINECMKDCKYQKKMFEDLTGKSLKHLWKEYCDCYNDKEDQNQSVPKPTCCSIF